LLASLQALSARILVITTAEIESVRFAMKSNLRLEWERPHLGAAESVRHETG